VVLAAVIDLVFFSRVARREMGKRKYEQRQEERVSAIRERASAMREKEKASLICRLSSIISHVSLCWLTDYDGYVPAVSKATVWLNGLSRSLL